MEGEDDANVKLGVGMTGASDSKEVLVAPHQKVAEVQRDRETIAAFAMGRVKHPVVVILGV